MSDAETEALRIEAMTLTDLDAVVTIDLASFHAGDLPRDRDPRIACEERLREELGRGFAHLRVARENSASEERARILGYTLFWHVEDELSLLNVAVDPTVRRRGVGRALMADLLDYAAKKAVSKILLEVRRSNLPAIALYESLGFETFNVRKRYYSDDEDALEMWLLFVAR